MSKKIRVVINNGCVQGCWAAGDVSDVDIEVVNFDSDRDYEDALDEIWDDTSVNMKFKPYTLTHPGTETKFMEY